MKCKIHLIAAARPNFMKIAPLYHALKKEAWAAPVIVHTGQHYDLNMSDAFFKDLNLPEPHIHLGAGSGSHAEQTGRVMIAYEKVLIETRPDLVIVVGDVNSTIACTLAVTKVVYPGLTNNTRPMVAHLEAGLRSYDRTMPEEINRIVTDSLADILWTPSPDGDENLIKEGIDSAKIVRVGNIMIDSLEMLREKIEAEKAWEQFGVTPEKYGIITLHRPSNVDDPDSLKKLCEVLAGISQKIPLIFPVHPRTRKNIEKYKLANIISAAKNLHIADPLNYICFMNLLFNCRFVITDSGGIQEETTYLGIPCFTMRPNTERPITVTKGTNQLCVLKDIEEKVSTALLNKNYHKCDVDLWDGETANRIVASIRNAVRQNALALKFC